MATQAASGGIMSPISGHSNRTQMLLAKLLQGREREWSGVAEKDKPLRLLDLPLDVLQAIVKEVTHTNDLTALALTHSSLHSLVIPHIYSRFDIVWPEANPTVESRCGVDALTYGLATLVMAHDVFGEAPYQQHCQSCTHCEQHRPTQATLQNPSLPMTIRRGNYFAQFTRKFSLGNGPADWVTEYLITKEGGKMLGTLVALALGRMRNLEAFIWDMPTGVLRDVWLALASLASRNDGRDCRLEKVWVRWHDNRDAAPLVSPPPPGSMHHTSLPSLLHGTASSLFQIPPYPTVEFPTFSILPPLKSISVLDIDEVPYAEELSILLDRSLDKLQELRVGVAVHAQRDLPFRPIDDRSAVPPPFLPNDESIRPGGILGILVGRFCTAFSTTPMTTASIPVPATVPGIITTSTEDSRSMLPSKDIETDDGPEWTDVNQLGALLSAQTLQDDTGGVAVHPSGIHSLPASLPTTPRKNSDQTPQVFDNNLREHHTRKMKLTMLELERIYLSIPVLSRALDWSRLESLTLLGCMNHEQLWKVLRRTFTPSSLRSRTPIKLGSASIRQRSSSTSYTMTDPSEYKLSIKRLHTDTVSKNLLAFIKDTLAPDSLEWLFLQETSAYKSNVTIDEIYRSAIRRHRGSLRKLLIDSELKHVVHHDREREREVDTNWRRWVCHQDLITCITSGKMQLRELSVSIDYKHWHYFMQRLPNAPGLRSLHIAHIAEHPSGRNFDPRDVAMSVLDIISLRSEIELCYLGVEKKCFEILEYKSSFSRRTPVGAAHGNGNGTIGISTHVTVEDEDDEDHDDGGAAHHIDHFSTEQSDEDADNWDFNSQASSNLEESDDEDDEDGEGRYGGAGHGSGRRNQPPTFRLREILFYDDKISIFKARHGKL